MACGAFRDASAEDVRLQRLRDENDELRARLARASARNAKALVLATLQQEREELLRRQPTPERKAWIETVTAERNALAAEVARLEREVAEAEEAALHPPRRATCYSWTVPFLTHTIVYEGRWFGAFGMIGYVVGVLLGTMLVR